MAQTFIQKIKIKMLDEKELIKKHHKKTINTEAIMRVCVLSTMANWVCSLYGICLYKNSYYIL